MTFYNELLNKSLEEVKSNFQRRNVGNLFSGRGGGLLDFQEKIFDSSNFKLITRLIV